MRADTAQVKCSDWQASALQLDPLALMLSADPLPRSEQRA